MRARTRGGGGGAAGEGRGGGGGGTKRRRRANGRTEGPAGRAGVGILAPYLVTEPGPVTKTSVAFML